MSQSKKIRTFLLGNKDTSALVARYLCRNNWSLDGIVTLSPNSRSVDSISGYTPIEAWRLPRAVPVHTVSQYTMGEADIAMFQQLNIDLLIVVGWQRIIPAAVLEMLSIGAFGMHGSSEPLPEGRGRSPLNWSIIQGKTSFITNLFRYAPGIDDGEIIDAEKFAILPSDDGGSLQLKNALAMTRILDRQRKAFMTNDIRLTPQQRTAPSYYPQRRPEDGEIHWHLSCFQVDRMVRAVSRPFPGATTTCHGSTLTVWRGQPFPDHSRCEAPGTITDVLGDGGFVVECGSGSYRVCDFETSGIIPKHGDKLCASTAYCWDWRQLPLRTPEFCRGYLEIPVEYRLYPARE